MVSPLHEQLPDDLLGDRRILIEQRPPLRAEGRSSALAATSSTTASVRSRVSSRSSSPLEGCPPALPTPESLKERRQGAGGGDRPGVAPELEVELTQLALEPAPSRPPALGRRDSSSCHRRKPYRRSSRSLQRASQAPDATPARPAAQKWRAPTNRPSGPLRPQQHPERAQRAVAQIPS